MKIKITYPVGDPVTYEADAVMDTDTYHDYNLSSSNTNQKKILVVNIHMIQAMEIERD